MRGLTLSGSIVPYIDHTSSISLLIWEKDQVAYF